MCIILKSITVTMVKDDREALLQVPPVLDNSKYKYFDCLVVYTAKCRIIVSYILASVQAFVIWLKTVYRCLFFFSLKILSSSSTQKDEPELRPTAIKLKTYTFFHGKQVSPVLYSAYKKILNLHPNLYSIPPTSNNQIFRIL